VGMVVGLLGILKAGGAYVPLDPAYPSQRLREILEDAGPRIVLGDAAGREVLGEEVLAEKMVLDLDSPQQQELSVWAEMPVTNPDGGNTWAEFKTCGLRNLHLRFDGDSQGGSWLSIVRVTNFHGAMKRSIYGACSSPLRVGMECVVCF